MIIILEHALLLKVNNKIDYYYYFIINRGNNYRSS